MPIGKVYANVPVVFPAFRELFCYRNSEFNYELQVTGQTTELSVAVQWSNTILSYATVRVLSFDAVANGLVASSTYTLMWGGPDLTFFNVDPSSSRRTVAYFNLVSIGFTVRPISIYSLMRLRVVALPGLTNFEFGGLLSFEVVTPNTANLTVTCGARLQLLQYDLLLFAYSPAVLFSTFRMFSVNSKINRDSATGDLEEPYVISLDYYGGGASYIGSYLYFNYSQLTDLSFSYSLVPNTSNS